MYVHTWLAMAFLSLSEARVDEGNQLLADIISHLHEAFPTTRDSSLVPTLEAKCLAIATTLLNEGEESGGVIGVLDPARINLL
jgi:hypothetical protein